MAVFQEEEAVSYDVTDFFVGLKRSPSESNIDTIEEYPLTQSSPHGCHSPEPNENTDEQRQQLKHDDDDTPALVQPAKDHEVSAQCVMATVQQERECTFDSPQQHGCSIPSVSCHQRRVNYHQPGMPPVSTDAITCYHNNQPYFQQHPQSYLHFYTGQQNSPNQQQAYGCYYQEQMAMPYAYPPPPPQYTQSCFQNPPQPTTQEQAMYQTYSQPPRPFAEHNFEAIPQQAIYAPFEQWANPMARPLQQLQTEKGGGGKMKRSAFTETQQAMLEAAFKRQQYLSIEQRNQLASCLGLDNEQVKVWYQNRRSRAKKNGEAVTAPANVEFRPFLAPQLPR